MKKLVGDHVFPIIAIRQLRHPVARFPGGGFRGISMAPLTISRPTDLVIFGPGVVDPGVLDRKRSFRRMPKDPPGYGAYPFHVIIHVLACKNLYDRVIAYAHEEKIRRMRQLHFPMIGAGAVAIFFWPISLPLDKVTYLAGQSCDLFRSFLIGFVDGREPGRIRPPSPCVQI